MIKTCDQKRILSGSDRLNPLKSMVPLIQGWQCVRDLQSSPCHLYLSLSLINDGCALSVIILTV